MTNMRKSRPVWGAWIEILVVVGRVSRSAGRAPYGARGLKLKNALAEESAAVVAPRMGRVD